MDTSSEGEYIWDGDYWVPRNTYLGEPLTKVVEDLDRRLANMEELVMGLVRVVTQDGHHQLGHHVSQAARIRNAD